MKYRPYGKKTNLMASVFGYGCMRMPQMKNEDGVLVPDQELANKMIRYAVDHGVNYFDSANGYMGGYCDSMLGEALTGGYRERVIIATKIHPSIVNSEADFFRILDAQLAKLKTDHIDVLLAHSLQEKTYEHALEVGMFDMMEKAKAMGKIRNLGFSFHDSQELFKKIVDRHDFVMCNVQMNLLDHDFQATVDGIEYAHEKGLAVCAMEPLRGGAFATAPEKVQQVYDAFPSKRSCVEWAFRDVYNMPGVSVVLSGINTMEQLMDNLRIFDEAEPNCMNEAELNLMSQVKATYDSLMAVPCTGCEYCLPCPSGVNIPGVFARWNNASMIGDWKRHKNGYQRMLKSNEGAPSCAECGACEAVCPQHIGIIGKLRDAHQVLSAE